MIEILTALSTAQVAALTTIQVAALTTTQVESLTSTQIGAMTTDQISKLTTGTPLILDLDGDGKLSQSITEGVRFDLFATGNKVNTGWVSSKDGLLVMDRNLDGTINDGSELFGSATQLADGSNASNGYVALGALDSNSDGVLTSADESWSKLSVWTDGNADGVSQIEELHDLDSLGIAKLNLDPSATVEKDAGNIVGLVSSYETSDGSSHRMADVWFVADKKASENATTPDLSSSASDTETGTSGIVQSIASFYDADAASAEVRPAFTADLGMPAQAGANMVGIVNSLRQFDANGKEIGTTVLGTAVVATPALNTVPSVDQLTQGMLASGK